MPSRPINDINSYLILPGNTLTGAIVCSSPLHEQKSPFHCNMKSKKTDEDQTDQHMKLLAKG
jgi:hypothetical protein